METEGYSGKRGKGAEQCGREKKKEGKKKKKVEGKKVMDCKGALKQNRKKKGDCGVGKRKKKK